MEKIAKTSNCRCKKSACCKKKTKNETRRIHSFLQTRGRVP